MNNAMRIIAIVEGQTEQIFIKNILAPYLRPKQIYMDATMISKPGQKGGAVCFSRASKDIGNHLKGNKYHCVTTMFDYYGLQDWLGLEAPPPSKQTSKQISKKLCEKTKSEIEDLLAEYRAEEKFIPYFSIHEFEALLFSCPQVLAEETGIKVQKIQAVLKKHKEPEAINNSRKTAPSKHLDKWNKECTNGSEFAKTTQGIAIAEKIGIAKMRERCPIFDAWLNSLEARALAQGQA